MAARINQSNNLCIATQYLIQCWKKLIVPPDTDNTMSCGSVFRLQAHDSVKRGLVPVQRLTRT